MHHLWCSLLLCNVWCYHTGLLKLCGGCNCRCCKIEPVYLETATKTRIARTRRENHKMSNTCTLFTLIDTTLTMMSDKGLGSRVNCLATFAITAIIPTHELKKNIFYTWQGPKTNVLTRSKGPKRTK